MGSRNTKQKSAIREAFQREGRPLSLDEVFGAARHSQPTLGLATVYRNIQVMLADGWLRSVEIPGDPVRYELAAQTRHDHFRCSRCSKVYDLEESFAPVTLKVPQGFQTTRQEFVFYGTCADCTARESGGRT